MSKIRFNIDIVTTIDTEDFILPVDGHICQSVKDEIVEAITTNTAIEVQKINVTGMFRYKGE